MSNYLLVSLDDDRAKKIAEIIGNKSAKKILDFLAERKEASESEISDGLGMPINTVEYNLNNLITAGIAEKSKGFFWSSRGRKIDFFRLAKKHIVISARGSPPRLEKIKAILPVVLLSGIGALIVRYFYQEKFVFFARESANKLADSTPQATIAAGGSASSLYSYLPDMSVWFFAGACLAVVIFALLNWRKL